MKRNLIFWVITLLGLQLVHTSATELFVSLDSSNPTAPYASWDSAATNIQDAIEASTDGDTIWVTNGVYQAGGKVMAGDLTNRVALDKAITVQSVNGPWVTAIRGAGATNGMVAVRCAWLTNGASLVGFTLTSGATRVGSVQAVSSGGGIYCASTNAFVWNCVIASNTASSSGGGVFQGTLNNCLISSNSAGSGAAYAANLNSCTVVSNRQNGVMLSTATNCIIYYNGFNYSGGVMAYCCSTPLAAGVGNFSAAPQLLADGVHLMGTSPCIGAGTNLTLGTDIFGRNWGNPPSVGCSEWNPSPVVTQPKLTLTGDPAGFIIGNVSVSGLAPLEFAWLKDGALLQENGHFSSTQTTNLVVRGVSFSDAGNYQLVVSNAYGMTTSAVAQVTIHCVDSTGANPTAPFTSWETAATNIQDAITVSLPGEIVLVTNGVYASGGKTMDGSMTNRVTVDKAILVQSVNGPASTIIQGAWDPVSTNGLGAERCAWLTTNAVLAGFTLRGGATRPYSPSFSSLTQGGGVWGTTTNATVFNCIIATNSAGVSGGGAYRVKLVGSTLIGNSVPTGSSGGGGGADSCFLKNCMITGNFAAYQGGGARLCNAINCAFTGNRSLHEGGGALGGVLLNCTVVNNVAGGLTGYNGAVSSSTLTNCLVFGNISAAGGSSSNYSGGVFAYCNTSPLPAGVGNISVDPQLLGDGIHLAATSPCIGAGIAGAASGTDIDGQSWNTPPSIGCDEWGPEPVIGIRPKFQINSPARGLTFDVVVAGQSPFTCFWSRSGMPIQDDTHYSNSGTVNMIVNDFGPEDAGNYQVVVSNAFGAVMSAVVPVVIHAVDAGSSNPVAPYSTWATAAGTIQDAIDVAADGDIVLVTNGVYASGGKVMAGDLTNRVAVDKSITVTSVNGYRATTIRGEWDPISTNGPGAVRCAWLGNGAVLSGFTLENGATRVAGDLFSLQSGGGVWSASTNGVASNCVLTNNSAVNGGGISFGTLNSSLVIHNLARSSGSGSYWASLNHCTVIFNYTANSFGAGTYEGLTRNSIVVGNTQSYPFDSYDNNYNSQISPSQARYSYSYTVPPGPAFSPMPSGVGNINGLSINAQFLDLFHIALTSPCYGAGEPSATEGTDLDGEPWNDPPSMGCDEVVMANLVGPLGVNLSAYKTNLLINRYGNFFGTIDGHASRVEWMPGDGNTITNAGSGLNYRWTNPGDYPVTFTAFNNDNPLGVSTNLLVHVLPLDAPLMESVQVSSNSFGFRFTGQPEANYVVQYTTNLSAPIVWQALQNIYFSTGQVYQITTSATNDMRFFRVWAQ